MKKAYIILAHKKPSQLCRLIQRLDDGQSTIFVHIDKKVPIAQFDSLLAFGKMVQLVDRVSSSWGGIGMVDATLNALKAIRNTSVDFERIILLSGQDYPIKSQEQIDNYLKKSSHSIFLDYFPLPSHEKWKADKGGMYRVNKYFFGLKGYQLFASKSMNFLGNFLPFLQRRIPDGMKPFAGSQWWIIDMYALNYILNYVQSHREYRSFHCNTFASDELFFHMILANSKDATIQQSIRNDNKRFMKWQTSWIAHPEILKTSDLADIMNSNALFARKFDTQEDSQILDMIDANCLKAVVQY